MAMAGSFLVSPSDDVASTPTAPEPAATPAPDAAPVTPTPADSAPSQSAEPTQGETREQLLDAVQQAVPELRSSQPGDDVERKGATPAPTAKDPSVPEEDDPSLPDDYSDEDLAKFSQGVRARIKRALKQRNQARQEVERLKTLEPGARAADSVQQYLTQHDIGRDDFLLTLDLAAALRRGDFRTFYEGVRPYVQLAEEYLGLQLPRDLQAAVQQGQMTTDAAARFSRERMDAAMHRNVSQRQQQRLQQQQQSFAEQQETARRERLADQVAAQVNTWEATVAKHDPDYAAKRTAVQETMWAVVREVGAPQSPDQAVQIAREAYRRVNDRYRSWAGTRRPTSRSPSSTGRTSGAAPEPKSLADAVRIAREGARL